MLVACCILPQFSIACERVRLPHLPGEPLALTAEDGAVCVASDEAMALGVSVGQALTAARAFCPQLLVLPYDRAAYELSAHSLWDLFAIESSIVEPVSPEVCFVELPDRAALERAQWLAEQIATRVNVGVQVGLAKTKMVARHAAMRSVGQQIVVVPPGRAAAFLAATPIELVPEIDAKLRLRLVRLGLRTLGDLAAAPSRELRRQFRQVSLLLERLAMGEDGDPVKPLWPPRSIDAAYAFDEEVTDIAFLHRVLQRCADFVAERLIETREYCRSMALVIGMADGAYLQEMERLGLPANDAKAIYSAALRLLGRIHLERPPISVRLKASDLGVGSAIPLVLFDDNEHGRGLPHERRIRLETTLAYLRRRYGAGAILQAGLLAQARRIRLWTCPLGHLLDEEIRVATDQDGVPVWYQRRRRRGQRWEVRSVQDRWREADWLCGRLSERTVFRVETDPSGTCELYHLEAEWRLSAMAD